KIKNLHESSFIIEGEYFFNYCRSILGIEYCQAVTKDMAGILGLGKAKGLLIGGVISAGPVGVVGMESGDIITECNGKEIKSGPFDAFPFCSGEIAKLKFWQNGREKTVDVEIGTFRINSK